MRREPIRLVVVHARLWSARPLPDVDALAVAGERIVAVGRAADVRALADPGVRVLDARGATVTPGLVDAHVHLLPWALSRTQPDLHGARSVDDALVRVRGALAGGAPRLLVGRGWDDARWPAPPHRAALDAVAPDVPVMLHSHDFHSLWVNGAALRAAGIAAGATDPPGGRWERDASGALTGVVRETATRPFHELEQALGAPVDERVLRDAASALHAHGVTAVHDFNRDAATLRWTQWLARDRQLRVLQQVGPEQLDGLLAAGVASGTGDEWFRIGALKLFADGTLGSRTAGMLEPFADRGGLGLDVTPAPELDALVVKAFSGGVSVAIHAIGDRAVRHALDAIERAAPGSRPLAVRPRIEHVQLAHPADVPRFARLGVVASMQPQHCVTDVAAARAAWGERCRGAYPWRALLASGASLVFGSDAPVEPPDASRGLADAQARRAAGVPAEQAFHPEQAVSLDEALAAYTSGPADLVAGDARSGRLEPGAVADLVVWDRDLHETGLDDLRTSRASVTVLGGEIVYESPTGAPIREG